MAELVLYHHAQGLTRGASRLEGDVDVGHDAVHRVGQAVLSRAAIH